MVCSFVRVMMEIGMTGWTFTVVADGVFRAAADVPVVLDRHADQAGHGILKLLGQFGGKNLSTPTRETFARADPNG